LIASLLEVRTNFIRKRVTVKSNDVDLINLTADFQTGTLKTRDWKTRDQMAGVENAGLENAGPTKYGKLKVT